MAVVLIKARRPGLTTLASLFAQRKSERPETPDDALLAELGIAEGWRPHPDPP